MTHALSLDPNVLLLDEPTNHLDRQNRTSLMRLLKSYSGTLIVVSHDTELLRYCMDTLWHVDNGQIQVFSGNYDDYICAVHSLRASIEKELIRLERQKKDMHHALMKEQKRAAKSKTQGEKNIHQKKWPTVVSAAKASRAEETSGRKKSVIDNKKQRLNEELAKLRYIDEDGAGKGHRSVTIDVMFPEVHWAYRHRVATSKNTPINALKRSYRNSGR